MTELSGHVPPHRPPYPFHPVIDSPRLIECALVLKMFPKGPDEHDGTALSEEEFMKKYGPPPELLKKIRTWLTSSNIAIVKEDPFIFWCAAPMRTIAQTFQMQFEAAYVDRHYYFEPLTNPKVPDDIAPYISGIVGLENTSHLESFYRQPLNAPATNGHGFTPQMIASAYQFPANLPIDSPAPSVTLGILSLNNPGYRLEDIQAFADSFDRQRPSVHYISLNNNSSSSHIDTFSDNMALTAVIEWVHALMPRLETVIYDVNVCRCRCGQSHSLALLAALYGALLHPTKRPDVLLMPFALAESRIPSATLQAWDSIFAWSALRGIPVIAPSGDNGAYGIEGPGQMIPHSVAPAVCPHVLAVGGTSLALDNSGHVLSETGWSNMQNNGASGGGLSQAFSAPLYQNATRQTIDTIQAYSRRGIPDVALNADPSTGYAVLFHGEMFP
ncbi:MAG: protease pro-enzyme activation domain-containing protein, partial [Firmicutes bacterium]|nr:protease pro-enzyme activation domain-containing protein [Bacillota bacterium]